MDGGKIVGRGYIILWDELITELVFLHVANVSVDQMDKRCSD